MASNGPPHKPPPRTTWDIFDLASSSWSSFEWPERQPPYQPLWTGKELVFPFIKQRYDPSTKRFTPMARQVERETIGPAVWADGALVHFEGPTDAAGRSNTQTPEGWAWDPSSGRWFKLRNAIRSFAGPLIWTGSELIKVGSYDFTDLGLEEKQDLFRFGP